MMRLISNIPLFVFLCFSLTQSSPLNVAEENEDVNMKPSTGEIENELMESIGAFDTSDPSESTPTLSFQTGTDEESRIKENIGLDGSTQTLLEHATPSSFESTPIGSDSSTETLFPDFSTSDSPESTPTLSNMGSDSSTETLLPESSTEPNLDGAIGTTDGDIWFKPIDLTQHSKSSDLTDSTITLSDDGGSSDITGETTLVTEPSDTYKEDFEEINF